MGITIIVRDHDRTIGLRSSRLHTKMDTTKMDYHYKFGKNKHAEVHRKFINELNNRSELVDEITKFHRAQNWNVYLNNQ